MLFCAAYGLGRWVPRAAFFVWLGLGAVDAAWAWLTLIRLDARYTTAGGTFTAGEGIAAELVLADSGRLPVAARLLREGAGSRLPFVLPPSGELLPPVRRAPAAPLLLRRRLPARRGRHRLGPLEICTYGPFGLAEAWRSLSCDREVLVLPRLQPLPPWPPRGTGNRGGQGPSSARQPDPAWVSGVRPLLPGDSLRRVHWRRSARTGAWVVKEFEAVARAGSLVLLDLSRASYARAGGDDLCDAAVEVAAALAGAALATGQEVHLRTTGERPIELALRAGGGDMRSVLLALAEARPDGPLAVGDHLRPGTARPVLVTPAPAEDWGRLLAARGGAGNEPAAVLILAPGEDRRRAEADCAALARLGIQAWAVTGAAELARQFGGAV